MADFLCEGKLQVSPVIGALLLIPAPPWAVLQHQHQLVISVFHFQFLHFSFTVFFNPPPGNWSRI